jgi:hypothetical protein
MPVLGVVILVIVVLWALGFFVAGMGTLVHLLLIVALIVLIADRATRRGGL